MNRQLQLLSWKSWLKKTNKIKKCGYYSILYQKQTCRKYVIMFATPPFSSPFSSVNINTISNYSINLLCRKLSDLHHSFVFFLHFHHPLTILKMFSYTNINVLIWEPYWRYEMENIIMVGKMLAVCFSRFARSFGDKNDYTILKQYYIM